MVVVVKAGTVLNNWSKVTFFLVNLRLGWGSSSTTGFPSFTGCDFTSCWFIFSSISSFTKLFSSESSSKASSASSSNTLDIFTSSSIDSSTGVVPCWGVSGSSFFTVVRGRPLFFFSSVPGSFLARGTLSGI